MRFGCCIGALVPPDRGTGLEMLGPIAAAGYDYAELALSRIATLSPPDYDRCRRQVAQSPIPCEAACETFPRELRLTGVRLAGRSRARVLRAHAEPLVGCTDRSRGEPNSLRSSESYPRHCT